jgi:hypothetical protein
MLPSDPENTITAGKMDAVHLTLELKERIRIVLALLAKPLGDTVTSGFAYGPHRRFERQMRNWMNKKMSNGK